MVKTRSSIMTETHSSEDLVELHAILAPITKNLQDTNKALENITSLFEKKFTAHKRQISNLQVRVQNLEEKMLYQEFVTQLHDRKLDDLEQNLRKVNIRLKNIPVTQEDSPQILLGIIKTEIVSLQIDIPEEEIDRCHRDGKPYYRNNERVQDVLVRFRTWRSRDIMYQNRKKFSFQIVPDLTKRRGALLKSLRDQCGNSVGDEPSDMSVHRIVDFVFCDKNCKVKFKSKDNKFFTISSQNEFFKLIQELDHNLMDSASFKDDENNRAKYGCFEEERTSEELFK